MKEKVKEDKKSIIKILKNIFWDVDIDAYKDDIPSLDVLKQQEEENRELIEKLEADTIAREKKIESKREALEKKYAASNNKKKTANKPNTSKVKVERRTSQEREGREER